MKVCLYKTEAREFLANLTVYSTDIHRYSFFLIIFIVIRLMDRMDPSPILSVTSSPSSSPKTLC